MDAMRKVGDEWRGLDGAGGRQSQCRAQEGDGAASVKILRGIARDVEVRAEEEMLSPISTADLQRRLRCPQNVQRASLTAGHDDGAELRVLRCETSRKKGLLLGRKVKQISSLI
jgi:hypothetical protein